MSKFQIGDIVKIVKVVIPEASFLRSTLGQRLIIRGMNDRLYYYSYLDSSLTTVEETFRKLRDPFEKMVVLDVAYKAAKTFDEDLEELLNETKV